jgi:hypothetical protein
MGENPFNLVRLENDPVILNGHIGTPGTLSERYFKNYPADYFLTTVSHLTVSTSGFPDVTQLVANQNPGNPAVSLPNFAYELKDLPEMLRHAADRARRWHAFVQGNPLSYRINTPGEDYLNYIFGWKPFFSDLASMLDISDFLKYRRKKYKSIRGSELRTGGQIGKAEQSKQSLVTIQSFSEVLTAVSNLKTTIEKWYSAKWTVDPIRFGEVLHDGRQNYLRDALNWDAQQTPLIVWEAMPWSWFLDWSFNVGAILNLMGNRQGCRFNGGSVMTRTETIEHVIPKKHSYVLTTLGKRTAVTKNRTLLTPTFTKSNAGFNIFEPGHLSIMAALNVTRGVRSSTF